MTDEQRLAPDRLHIRIEPGGPPPPATVLFVHGAGGRADQWRRVVAALARPGVRTVAFDALGHGSSARPRRWTDYRGEERVADLLALMRRHAHGRLVLAAHSYGATIALGALLEDRSSVSQAVLVAPPPTGAARPVPWFAYLPVPLLERMRPRLSAGFRAAAWGPAADPALVDEETAISDRNALFVFKAQLRQRLQLDEARLHHLDLPVTVLVGDADRLTPPDGARRLTALLPRARLTVLPSIGHQVPLEDPQAVADAIGAALSEATDRA